MSATDYFAIMAAICLAQTMNEKALLLLGLISTALSFIYMFIGK